jgi:hypothetical protein
MKSSSSSTPLSSSISKAILPASRELSSPHLIHIDPLVILALQDELMQRIMDQINTRSIKMTQSQILKLLSIAQFAISKNESHEHDMKSVNLSHKIK